MHKIIWIVSSYEKTWEGAWITSIQSKFGLLPIIIHNHLGNNWRIRNLVRPTCNMEDLRSVEPTLCISFTFSTYLLEWIDLLSNLKLRTISVFLSWLFYDISIFRRVMSKKIITNNKCSYLALKLKYCKKSRKCYEL